MNCSDCIKKAITLFSKYVIFHINTVGSGTAGSVLAARLSEDKDVSVLLLEAGPEATDPFVRVPRTWLSVLNNPELDWGYYTEPQPYSPTKKVKFTSEPKV